MQARNSGRRASAPTGDAYTHPSIRPSARSGFARANSEISRYLLPLSEQEVLTETTVGDGEQQGVGNTSFEIRLEGGGGNNRYW